MTTSNLSWDLDGSKLIVDVLAISKKLTFDITEIYTDFDKYTDVQQKLIAYGLKQKLADKVAKPSVEKLTPTEMLTELKALWEQLVGGIWRVAGIGGTSKVQTAWDKASASDQKVLVKLGLKPKDAVDKIVTKLIKNNGKDK